MRFLAAAKANWESTGISHLLIETNDIPRGSCEYGTP
jgi:hypothetical protein